MKRIFKFLLKNWLLIIAVVILLLEVIYINYKNYITISDYKKTETHKTLWP